MSTGFFFHIDDHIPHTISVQKPYDFNNCSKALCESMNGAMLVIQSCSRSTYQNLKQTIIKGIHAPMHFTIFSVNFPLKLFQDTFHNFYLCSTKILHNLHNLFIYVFVSIFKIFCFSTENFRRDTT